MAAIIQMLEGLTPLCARSIKEFIGSNAAKEGIGWFTGKKLDEIFNSDDKSKSIHEKLKSVHTEFEKINSDSAMKITVARDWKHWNTRIFQAEMDISQKFQLLQTILANIHSTKRGRSEVEVERLRNGILDTNSGVLNNLSVIHQILVGQTTDPTNNGLLEMWSKVLNTNMLENPMSAKTCYDHLMNHLNKAAIVQFKGFLLFKGANDNVQFCSDHFKLFEENLKAQSDFMEKTMPKHMKYLVDPREENIFYLRPVLNGLFEPFVKRRKKGETLQFEYHLAHYADEKWRFRKSLDFNVDGSLYIEGLVNGKRGSKPSYVIKKDKKKAICSENPQSFYVMPLYKENSVHIAICKQEHDSPRFLGNRLEFVNNGDNIEFTMTKTTKVNKKETKWEPLKVDKEK